MASARSTGRRLRGAARGESGLLPHLHHPVHLSPSEGRADRPDTIIVDAKSGTSGAGRGAKVDNLFCEVNENIKAYGVATHRHTPEIEEQLGYAAGRPVRIISRPIWFP